MLAQLVSKNIYNKFYFSLDFSPLVSYNIHIMFRDYYLKIKAVRITQSNFQELKELDTGDGVLDADMNEN